MVFVINNLKYDTDKMELISDKCEYSYSGYILDIELSYRGKDVCLWKSKKGNWLLTYRTDYSTKAKAIDEEEVKSLLIRYDLVAYEKLFGEIEEA